MGLVLLLGQLPLARSYQVQKGFSCSPFCTRKYLPCLVVPVNRLIKARPLANIPIRHSLWERRRHTALHHVWKKGWVVARVPREQGCFSLWYFGIFFCFCKGMAWHGCWSGWHWYGRQRKFYQETMKPHSRWHWEGRWMATCTYGRMINRAWRFKPKGSGCTRRKAPLTVWRTTTECTAACGRFKHLGNSGQKYSHRFSKWCPPISDIAAQLSLWILPSDWQVKSQFCHLLIVWP